MRRANQSFLAIIMLFIFSVFFNNTVNAQNWESLFNETRTLLSSDDAEAAYAKSKELLNVAESTYGNDHEAYGYSLILAFRAAYGANQYEEAVKLGEMQLALSEKLKNPRDQNYAQIVNELAQLYNALDRVEPSVESYKEYLAVLREIEQGNTPQYANGLFNLASLYYSINNTAEAKNTFGAALNIYNDFPEAMGEEYLFTLFYLGNIAFEADDLQETTIMFSALRGILVDNELTAWEIYPTVLYGLGIAYADKKQQDEALAIYVELIELLEATEQTELPIYNSALNNAASIYQFKGDLAQAEQLLGKAGNSTVTEGGATAASNQAALAFARGDYQTAINLLQPQLAETNETKADSLAFEKVVGQLAQYYFAFGNVKKADSLFFINEDYILALEGDRSAAYASFLQNRGWFYYSTGEVAKGKLKLQESLQLKKDLFGDKDVQLTVTLNSLGVILQAAGQYREATEYFKNALDIIQNTRGTQNTEYAATLNNLAAVRQEAGAFSEAESYFHNALRTLAILLGSDHEEYANTLNNLGALYLSLGNNDRADSVFKQSLQVFKNKFGVESEPYANTLLSRSKVQTAKADFTAAEDLLREAISIIRRISGDKSVAFASANNDLAFLYQTVGNFNGAEPLLEASLKIFETQLGNRHPFYITTIENLATLKQQKGEFDKAEQLLLLALEADKEVYGTRHPNYAVTLHNLAALYQATDQIEQAEIYYLESIEIDREVYGELHPDFATTMYNLAVLYQDKDELELADSLISKVIKIRKQILGEKHPEYLYSLYGKAVLLQRMGKNDDAMPLFDMVIEEYLYTINEYFPSLSENEKSAYFQKLNPVFLAYKDFALEMSDEHPIMLEKLMDLQLSSKAILLNATNKVRNRILNSGDATLIAYFKQWQELKDDIVKYYSYTLEQLSAENINLKELEQLANDLERELSRSSEAFAKEFDKQKVSWRSIQERLKQDEALVEIIRLRKNLKNDSIIYVAIIIRGDSSIPPHSIVMPNGKEIEGKYFAYYKNHIRYQLEDKLSFRHFWEDIDRELTGATTIYVSPDGVYNKLNLNTIYKPNSKRYLLEDQSFRFLSSSRDLLDDTEAEKPLFDQSMDPEIPQMQAALFGFPNYNFGIQRDVDQIKEFSYSGFRSGVAPLPSTEIEVQQLDSILTSNNWVTKVYMDKQATEEAFHKMQSPSLLHIATHGFFLEDITGGKEGSAFGIHLQNVKNNPLLRSGLLFAGAELTMLNMALPDSLENDGVLTAYETMNLNLDNTQLVVLSACETGLGEVKNGEGVYGLQRAFMVAGAKNLVMSLWKVNDYTTQRLMTQFYSNWASGMNKQEAFKQAQISLKKEFEHPYYWGAFIMIGK